MQTTIQIPDEYVEVFSPNGEDIARVILELCTAHAYQTERITRYQAQCILGFSNRWELEPFLKKYDIPFYTAEMLEEDLKRLESLPNPSSRPKDE